MALWKKKSKNRSLWFPRLIRNSRLKKNVCLTFRIFCCWRLDDVNIVGILCRSQKTFTFFRNFLCRHDFHKKMFLSQKTISRRFLTVWNTSISQIFFKSSVSTWLLEKKVIFFLSHKIITRRYFTIFWIISEISFNCSNFTNVRKELSKSTWFLENSTVTQSAQFIKTTLAFSSRFFFVCYDFWQKRWHPARSAVATRCFHGFLWCVNVLAGNSNIPIWKRKKWSIKWNESVLVSGWWITSI